MSDYLNSILNAFHDLLFVFSEDGIIEDYLTTADRKELIMPVEGFIGKHHQEVLPVRISNKIKKGFQLLDEGRKQYIFDYHLEINGEKRWFVAVLSKLLIDNEQKFLGAVRDITERKNKELLLRGVLNSTPSGIIVLRSLRDSGGHILNFEITHVNNVLEEITGMPDANLTGKKVTQFLPANVQEEILSKFKSVVESDKTAEFEYLFENNPEEDRWFQTKAAKFKDGLIVSFLDITNQKEYQKKLTSVNDELKQLNRQKDKILSVISHDLKNAFAGTLGLYEIISDEFDSLSRDELFQYFETLKQESRNASQLLDDLLLWAKDQFQNITPDPITFNLKDAIDSVLVNVSSQAKNKNIEINLQVNEIEVYADMSMVKTILRNLIINAIKFSHEGQQITLQAERNANEIEISVKDEGVGMKPDVVEKIMSKQTTYTSMGTKGEMGSGLGLDLCMDFVELHGGDIWVDSEPGEGSMFTFTIPPSKSSSD